MQTKFNVSGLFYKLKNCCCRKYLNIQRIESNVTKPDLIVVMMNPGSSKPMDGNDDNTVEVEAIPDKTQEQIMKVMDACDFNFARILNLSDIRESKSKIFYSSLRVLAENKIYHSIFDDNRKKDIPVIFAWGVDKKLDLLALQAISKMSVLNPYGILKQGTNSAYYHPLPQVYAKQQEWLEKIVEQITFDNLR